MIGLEKRKKCKAQNLADYTRNHRLALRRFALSAPKPWKNRESLARAAAILSPVPPSIISFKINELQFNIITVMLNYRGCFSCKIATGWGEPQSRAAPLGVLDRMAAGVSDRKELSRRKFR